MTDVIQDIDLSLARVQNVLEQGPVGPAGPDGADGATGADGTDGIFSEIASQAEAEAGTDNTKGMTSLRVWQAVIKWAATAASIFKGILSGYTEAYGTITITTGAGSLVHSTAENIQRVTLAANTIITITNPTNLKALTLEIAQTAGPWTLDISCNSLTLAITLNGVSGEPKEIVELWSDGTDMFASNGDGTWSKGV